MSTPLDPPRACVVLNPHARGGRGRAIWSELAPRLAGRLWVEHVIETDTEGCWLSRLSEAIRSGSRFFVAAGGDGTVKALVNGVFQQKGHLPLFDFTIGAVGLGSSNDFHKPFRDFLSGVPLRIDFAARAPRDVGLAEYSLREVPRSELFAISASLGLVAEANAFFNEGDAFLRPLKRLWTGGAILYAAIRTLLRYRNREAQVSPSLDESHGRLSVTSLSIMKTSYLSGSFRFDTPVRGDDGLFAVNLLEGMSRLEVLRAMVDLSNGRFLGPPKRSSKSLRELQVILSQPSALELDGEVTLAEQVRFSVLNERIQVCQ